MGETAIAGVAAGADPQTVAAGTSYLVWCLPGMGLQFALVSMAAALRGTGIQVPTMILQMVTVVVNAVLSVGGDGVLPDGSLAHAAEA